MHATRRNIHGHVYDNNGDFTCKHCGRFVSADILLVGARNRNHCPYCLWSRHLDHERPGDRLSACKGAMRPVGLTLKRTGKKYHAETSGELMLIHECAECGKLSINRIAADDLAERVLEVFARSLKEWLPILGDIQLLKNEALVRTRLFGWKGEPEAVEMAWGYD